MKPEIEKPGAIPRYLPGDVVRVGDWRGVIVNAQVVRNGKTINWYDHSTDDAEQGKAPSYLLEPLPGQPERKKYAWYISSEWDDVELGLLHKVLKRD